MPLTDDLADLLRCNIGRHPDAVFTYVAKATRDGREKGERYPLTYGAFYDEFKRAARLSGAPEARVHDLRHTAVTNVLRATGNLVAAQKVVGHSSISTTRRYAELTTDEVRESLRAVESGHKSGHTHVTKSSTSLIEKEESS